jgi:hypothetical protein
MSQPGQLSHGIPARPPIQELARRIADLTRDLKQSQAALTQAVQRNTVGPWTTYTPAWTGSTTDPDAGGGSVSGRYQRIGFQTVLLEVYVLLGAGMSVGAGNYSLSLPVPAANTLSSNVARGAFWFRDVSGNADYQGFGLLGTSTNLQIRGLTGTATSSVWSSAGPVVPASGDWLSGSFFYETAS